ncbi:MAG: flagellar hook-basal body complex protein, partial [Alphaproteobacteria bacterium]|nr:flagellar hook-basal body complex protein [Alphaproteobacteria bacterium]
MSFYTSLTGLNGAQADISTISNNIANVGTTGFKRSRAEFGDIFATSPLQNASSAVGSGTILKSIKQQFTQGNIQSSLNALDLAISGQGFFAMKPSLTSSQTVYTRNGSFSVNNDRYVVDDKGQYLQVFPVNDDGSVTSTGAASATNLQLPVKSGLPNATTLIQLGLNLPADAAIIPQDPKYTSSNPYVFNHNDPTTFNKSTSITIYDSLGNPTISTIYYLKTSNSTDFDPTNKWMTHVFVGDKELNPSLITAKDAQSDTLYVNKFGQTTTDPTQFDPSFVANQPSPLYYQDDQIKQVSSTPAKVVGEIQNAKGFDFGDTDANKVSIVTDPSAYSTTHEANAAVNTSTYWGKDMFTVSVDGSTPQSISINAGAYTGDELAAEMTRAVNAKFSDAKYFRISDTFRDASGTVNSGNDVFNINLSSTTAEGTSIALSPPLEIDLLGTSGAMGTPAAETTTGVKSQQLNYQDLTREDLISLAQSKVNEQLNARHNDFGKAANWVDVTSPPIIVGFDVSSRSLTFKVDPSQLGSDAQLPENRYQNIQVYNPTNALNDLGLPTQTTSNPAPIGTNSEWMGQAVLPSGPPITAANDQRTGITVNYNKDTRQFEFSSGTTGESSKITVGRTTLAQTADDTMTQINSYDLSHMDMSKSQSVTLESDGRAFTYSYDPTAAGNSVLTSSEAFISNLKQALPVSFSPTAESKIGSSGQSEVQTITPWGNLLSGDQFTINLQLAPSTTSTNTGPSVSISPITLPVFARSDSNATRLQKLADAIQTAIDTQNNIGANDTKPVIVSVSGASLTFTYQPGFVSHEVTISQITRGTDATGQTAIPLTDRTVIAAPTVVTKAGNSKTQEIQSINLQPEINTNTLQIQAGDVY